MNSVINFKVHDKLLCVIYNVKVCYTFSASVQLHHFPFSNIQVYVKDESPPKKKTTTTVAVATTATSEAEKQQHSKAGAAVATATDGLNSLVQAAGIQIVSDADGTRVQQYKCAMQVSIHKCRAAAGLLPDL